MNSLSLQHCHMNSDRARPFPTVCLPESYSSVPLYAASLSVKTNGNYWKILAGWMNHWPLWNGAAHLVSTRLQRCFVVTSKAAWRTLIPDSERRERAGGRGARCLSLAIRDAASAACHLWSKFITLCPVRLVPAKWRGRKAKRIEVLINSTEVLSIWLMGTASLTALAESSVTSSYWIWSEMWEQDDSLAVVLHSPLPASNICL